MNKKISVLKSLLAISVAPILIISCATSSPSSGPAENAMSYSHLRLMDLDQMTEFLQQKVKVYRRTDNPEPLKQGLQVCLSRPDEDHMVEKTLPLVRDPLEDLGAWETAVEELVDKNLEILKNKNAHSSDQVTAGIILENLIGEFRPAFVKQYQSPAFETTTIERIAMAKVEFNREAVSERKLTLMRGAASPSLIAQKMLDQRKAEFKALAKEKK